MDRWYFKGIELDDDGYPYDKCLDDLKSQPINFFDAARFIVETLGGSQDRYYSSARVSDGKCGFTDEPIKWVLYATGGWSGNEAIIGTATARVDVAHFLKQWNAGGLWQFQVPLTMLLRNAG